MNTIDQTNNRIAITLSTIRLGTIAGAAGGLAEIAWVSLYAGITGDSAAVLARGVTTAAGVSSLFPADAVTVGLTVHMAIAVALGITLAFAWQAIISQRKLTIGLFPFMTAALAGVWAINFFVVLPVVSPDFVSLLPYSVSLASKMLFGLAAAGFIRLMADPSTSMQFSRIVRRA